MKLWQKISLVCVCVLICIVTVCCTLLLLQSKSNILNLTVKQAEEKQLTLETSFSQMFSYYGDKNDSPVTEYSLAVYCFSQFADNTSVFIMDGETVYSNINLLPETILPVTGHEQQTYLGETDGRHILIVGSSTVVNDKEAMIYVVEDVSSVYHDIARMAWSFIAISAAGTLVGAVLITSIYITQRPNPSFPNRHTAIWRASTTAAEQLIRVFAPSVQMEESGSQPKIPIKGKTGSGMTQHSIFPGLTGIGRSS